MENKRMDKINILAGSESRRAKVLHLKIIESSFKLRNAPQAHSIAQPRGRYVGSLRDLIPSGLCLFLLQHRDADLETDYLLPVPHGSHWALPPSITIWKRTGCFWMRTAVSPPRCTLPPEGMLGVVCVLQHFNLTLFNIILIFSPFLPWSL